MPVKGGVMITRKPVQSVGMVGFGGFGKFFASHLVKEFDVCAFDINNQQQEAESMGVQWGELNKVCKQDMVVLAVPLDALDQLLADIAPMVCPNALMVDVCSVKMKPTQLLEKHLPECHFLSTHPLFGPKSARNGTMNHKIVICPPHDSQSPKAKFFQEFLEEKLGLRVISISAQDHDREMAMVQGLTHFVARGLKGCGLQKSEFATVAFDHMCQILDNLGSDSWDLFKTIELGNPFAQEMRTKLMVELHALENRLHE